MRGEADPIRRSCTGRARRWERDAVNALRIETYARAPEFRLLRPDLLEWDGADHPAVVLAGWSDEGVLVSTFQGIIAQSAEHAERIMGVSIPLDASYFPGLILGRAATAPAFARAGLNSVLRLHFLRAAIAARLCSNLGLAYTAAPRIKTMASMGYEFVRPDRVWDAEVEAVTPPLVAYLDQRNFPTALDTLSAAAVEPAVIYPWKGPALVLFREP